MVSDRIYHIATRQDWEAARRSASYATSTRGRTLEQEGFIHACRRDQVRAVFAHHYRDASDPLVVLAIDVRRLGVEVREEAVGATTYPHIYGAVPARAVVATMGLGANGPSKDVVGVVAGEAARRMLLATVVMCAAVAGAVIGGAAGAWGNAIGFLVGAAAGAAISVWWAGRPPR